MKIKREQWEAHFFIDSFPNWECPTCKKGFCILESKSIVINEGLFSQHNNTKKHKSQSFTGVLMCSNSNCKERISIIGRIQFRKDYFKKGNAFSQSFEPLLLAPMPTIIPLLDEYPYEVNEELEKAFQIYWLDTSACANKIRNVVSLILDDKGVRKTTTKVKTKLAVTKKRVKLTLHNRIEEFKRKNKEVAEHFMAIKWIGNAGSHLTELEHEDILNAFEMLQLTLKNLYDDDIKRINSIRRSYTKN